MNSLSSDVVKRQNNKQFYSMGRTENHKLIPMIIQRHSLVSNSINRLREIYWY